MRQLDALNADLKAAGAWVFAGGLHPPSTATVLRAKDSEVLMTDGPYLESKEDIGGFTIITAPDLDAALDWGRRLAQIVNPLAVEVRPFHGASGGWCPEQYPPPRSGRSLARSRLAPIAQVALPCDYQPVSSTAESR